MHPQRVTTLEKINNLVLFEHAISVLERSKFVHVSEVVAAVTGKYETV
jgi:hypothetical protein